MIKNENSSLLLICQNLKSFLSAQKKLNLFGYGGQIVEGFDLNRLISRSIVLSVSFPTSHASLPDLLLRGWTKMNLLSKKYYFACCNPCSTEKGKCYLINCSFPVGLWRKRRSPPTFFKTREKLPRAENHIFFK